MTKRELTGVTKAFQYGILKAKESKRSMQEYTAALASGDEVTAEIKLRMADTARGEAYGIAETLTLIGGVWNHLEYPKAIYHELGE